jgi:hypothetical protein
VRRDMDVSFILLGVGGALSSVAYIIGYKLKKKLPLIFGAVGLIMFLIAMMLNIILILWS